MEVPRKIQTITHDIPERLAKSPANTLGSALRATRLAAGVTLKEIEVRTGISNAYLSQLETGKIVQPKAERIGMLAEAYGLPVGTLLHLAGMEVAEALRGEVLVVPGYIWAAAEVLRPEDWEALRGAVEWVTALRRASTS